MTSLDRILGGLVRRPEGFPRWPWPILNQSLGGVPPGRLTVIGARPGNGKTTFLVNAIRQWAEDGVPVCYMGTEQSPEETWWRLAALSMAVPPVLVVEHRWEEIGEQVHKSATEIEMNVTETVQSLHRRWSKTLICEEAPRLTASSFLAISQRAVESGCKIVVLDHVLRLRFDLQSLTAAVGDLVTEAKEFAKRANVHVVLAAQLSRPSKELGLSAYTTPPRADQLKQSGSLEQEADIVLLLHRQTREGLSPENMTAVRMGRADLASLFEPQVLCVTVGKHRLRSHLTDRKFKLWVEPWDEIREVRDTITREREPGEDESDPPPF